MRGPSRRAVSFAFLALGAALLAQGLWIPAKAELAQHLLNRAWNATREGGHNVKPWPWADTWPVARIRLPRAGAPLVVLAGASGRTLAFAPALLDGSAPLGAPGVTVIAAHRDTHFRGLASLALGDRFEVERPDGAVYAYDVAAIDVIDTERDHLDMNADESVVALVTCWPFDAVTPGGSERYVVTGRLHAPAANDASATVKPNSRKLSAELTRGWRAHGHNLRS
jgi:sortase A